MTFIKEFCPSPTGDGTHIIRSDTYASTFAHFCNLVGIARISYPDLKDADIEIKQYGGRDIKHTFGIEFRIPGVKETPAREGYRQIREVPRIM